MTDNATPKNLIARVIPTGLASDESIDVHIKKDLVRPTMFQIYLDMSAEMNGVSDVEDGRVGWWITKDQAHVLLIGLAEAIAEVEECEERR